MSYTNHYSHTSASRYHCKCKLTEIRREKYMFINNNTEKIQTKMHFNQEDLLFYFLISNMCLGTLYFQCLTTSEISVFLPVSTCWS